MLVWPGCLDPDASAGHRWHQRDSELPFRHHRARGRGQFAGRMREGEDAAKNGGGLLKGSPRCARAGRQLLLPTCISRLAGGVEVDSRAGASSLERGLCKRSSSVAPLGRTAHFGGTYGSISICASGRASALGKGQGAPSSSPDL